MTPVDRRDRLWVTQNAPAERELSGAGHQEEPLMPVSDDTALEAAAHALWASRSPDTPLESLEEDEREGAWANCLTDAEATIEAYRRVLLERGAVR